MKNETEFRRKTKAELERRGAMVSVIEPAIGSTPGVPDLLVSVDGDLWTELKITKRVPTASHTWNNLCRASQRKWMRERAEKMDVPVYVAVWSPLGVWIFYFSVLSGDLKGYAQNLSMSEFGEEIVRLCGG